MWRCNSVYLLLFSACSTLAQVPAKSVVRAQSHVDVRLIAAHDAAKLKAPGYGSRQLPAVAPPGPSDIALFPVEQHSRQLLQGNEVAFREAFIRQVAAAAGIVEYRIEIVSIVEPLEGDAAFADTQGGIVVYFEATFYTGSETAFSLRLQNLPASIFVSEEFLMYGEPTGRVLSSEMVIRSYPPAPSPPPAPPLGAFLCPTCADNFCPPGMAGDVINCTWCDNVRRPDFSPPRTAVDVTNVRGVYNASPWLCDLLFQLSRQRQGWDYVLCHTGSSCWLRHT
ncbi:hypothetical protein CYMTET_10564 [Cymbomonas tetramitiformis]|uniref:Uncharacterized protein n=1 Tax=Cymbomonas tetramitiformis TaxID=36881 RepID=A0AAE0GPC1_9CHLO|nr:hypothetical protein CYMTET_10564 [Cymbomonas tetramitiformis]